MVKRVISHPTLDKNSVWRLSATVLNLVGLMTVALRAEAQVVKPVDKCSEFISSSFTIIPPIPPAIQSGELKRYTRMLRQSEDQYVWMTVLYQNYLDGRNETCILELTPLRESAEILAQSTRANDLYSREYVHEYESFFARCAGIRTRLNDADSRFFNELSATLSPEQLESLARVRRDRLRVAHLHFGQMIPAAQVDLVKFVESFQYSDESMRAIDGILDEYERDVTPRLVENYYEFRSTNHEIVRRRFLARVDSDGTFLPEDSPQRLVNLQHFRDYKDSIYLRWAIQQSELAQLNYDCVKQLVQSLPKKDGEQLLSKYRAIAFRSHIYPDPCNPRTIVDSIQSQGFLSPEHQQFLTVTWQEYQRKHHDLCLSMEAAWNAKEFERCRTMTSRSGREHRDILDALWLRRHQANLDYVRSLASFLPPEILGKWKPELDAYEQRAEKVFRSHQSRMLRN